MLSLFYINIGDFLTYFRLGALVPDTKLNSFFRGTLHSKNRIFPRGGQVKLIYMNIRIKIWINGLVKENIYLNSTLYR